MAETDKRMNPQVQRTQGLMLDAAGDLLTESGPEAVTHLRVAEEAGVARATVYRHWPNRADILLDLLRTGANRDLVTPDPDLPVTERVASGLRIAATALAGDSGRALSAMIGLAEWDDAVSDALKQIVDFGPGMLRSVLSIGVDRGELNPETNVDLLADRLIGPLILRRLLYHDDITDAYVDRLVSETLSPHLPS
jgi:AcrR family transcriptional regulator